MKKEKLTPEQREEKFSKLNSIMISIILWILGLSVATMMTSACIYAIFNIIKLMMEG